MLGRNTALAYSQTGSTTGAGEAHARRVDGERNIGPCLGSHAVSRRRSALAKVSAPPTQRDPCGTARTRAGSPARRPRDSSALGTSSCRSSSSVSLYQFHSFSASPGRTHSGAHAGYGALEPLEKALGAEDGHVGRSVLVRVEVDERVDRLKEHFGRRR